MFRCESCKHIFEEGEERKDKFEEGRSYCPICSGEFYEVSVCEICHKSYEVEEGEKFCEGCKKRIEKRFSDFMNENFTQKERELLNELYDGKNI